MDFSHKLLAFFQRHFSAICRPVQAVVAMVEYWALEAWWTLRGYRKPTSEDVSFVAENVTIMFKSFERQKQEIVSKLDATRRIGVAVTDSDLLVPSKSVTAVCEIVRGR